MILYSSSPFLPVVSSVTNFPWSDFFGITYSEIGANSSRGSVSDEEADEARERERERVGDGLSGARRERAREREREPERELVWDEESSIPVREREVIKSSGT
jgi:hypothetical protein